MQPMQVLTVHRWPPPGVDGLLPYTKQICDDRQDSKEAQMEITCDFFPPMPPHNYLTVTTPNCGSY